MPSVPAGALLTPRAGSARATRIGPGGLPHRPAAQAPNFAVPTPRGTGCRILAPAPVPPGVAWPRTAASGVNDPIVAQSRTSVRSELQTLQTYAAQLRSAVYDKQAQLTEAVNRNKGLVEGDQIIAQSCAGVQEELHRLRSYAATLSTVVEDKQVVSELGKMSDFAKELEGLLPQRPLQSALSS